MRRALILLAAADAAAKFALEKKGQKVLNVKLYETGYTFTTRGGHGRPRGGNTCDRCLRGLCSRFVVGVV